MIPRDNRESINQSNQNSNIYINIIIKRHNRPHNLRTIMDNYQQNGFKVIYKITEPIEIINSFIIQTKSKNKAIDYAKKFTTTNNFKLIEVVENY